MHFCHPDMLSIWLPPPLPGPLLPPHPAERAAISNMIHHFGGGLFATVMDSYDYQRVRGERGGGVRRPWRL
jgi:hypothetical protein